MLPASSFEEIMRKEASDIQVVILDPGQEHTLTGKTNDARAWRCLFLLCPPMVQRSGRFKTTHAGCYPSAKAYGEVRRFETALYRTLFGGQSKKKISRYSPEDFS
jgi:hypothetical protein